MSNKTTMILIVAVLLIAGIPLMAQADTNVSSDITSNTTWTTSGSPYVIKNSISISNSATLTIQAGVTVKFDSGVTLTVDGALVAKGTASSPITFTSSSASPSYGSWDILLFSSSCRNGSCTIDYCKFEYANTAMYLEYVGLNVTNTTYFKCNRGLYLYDTGGASFLYNLTFEDNYYQGLYAYRSTTYLTKAYLNYSHDTGYYFEYEDGYSRDLVAKNCSWTGYYIFYGAPTFKNLTSKNGNVGFYIAYNQINIEGLKAYDCDRNYFYSYTGSVRNVSIYRHNVGAYFENNQGLQVTNMYVEKSTYRDIVFNDRASPIVRKFVSNLNSGNCSVCVQMSSAFPTLADSSVVALGASKDVYMEANTKMNFLNVTYQKPRLSYYDGSPMINVQDYFDLTIKNQTSSKVADARYWVVDKSNAQVWSGRSDSNGKAKAVFNDKVIRPAGETSLNPNKVTAVHPTKAEIGTNQTTITKNKSVNVTMADDANLIVWNGEHVLASNEYYTNKKIVARGNVNVTGPWRLGLTKVTFMFDHPWDGQRGLRVDSSGFFNATNTSFFSIFGSGTTLNKYVVDIDHSTGTLMDSNMSNLWSNGINLYYSEMNLTRSNITAGSYNCVNAYYSTLHVERCNFTGSTDYAFYNRYSYNTIRNSTFAKSNNGIYLSYSSKSIVERTTFTQLNSYGIQTEYDSITLKNITVTKGNSGFYFYQTSAYLEYINYNNCTGTGMYDEYRSNVKVVKSRFENCSNGVRAYSSTTRLFMDDCLLKDISNDALYINDGAMCVVNKTTIRKADRGVNVYGSDSVLRMRECRFERCSYQSILVQYSKNMRLDNTTIFQTNGWGIMEAYSTEIWFVNCTLQNIGASYDLYTYQNTKAYMLASTYSLVNSRIYSGSQIANMSFCTVRVIDALKVGVKGANIDVKDNMNNSLMQAVSGTNGYKYYVPITLKVHYESSEKVGNPHTFSAYNHSGSSVYSGTNKTTATAGRLVNITIVLDPTAVYWGTDHVLSSNESYKNKKIVAAGNVTIPSPFWLAFDNVTLMMENPVSGAKGIWVQDGGRFNCSKSVIKSTGQDAFGSKTDFYFRVGSSTGAGLRLNSTTLTDTTSQGIQVRYCTDIRITGSTLMDDSQYGLYLDYSKAVVSNTTFKNHYYGIYLEYCNNVSVNDTQFETNSNDIYCYYSQDIYVNRDRFNKSSNIANYIVYSQRYRMDKCRIYDVNTGIYADNSIAYSTACNYSDGNNREINAYYGSTVYSTGDRFYNSDRALSADSYSSTYPARLIAKNALIEGCSYGLYVNNEAYVTCNNITMRLCSQNVYSDSVKSLQVFDSKMYKSNGYNIGTYSCQYQLFKNTTILGSFYDNTIYNNNGKLLLQNCSVLDPDTVGCNASRSTNSAFTRFLNCTITLNNIDCYDSARTEVCKYYHARVRTSAGVPIVGINVTSKDALGTDLGRSRTNSGGYGLCLISKQYEETATGLKQIYNPHNVSADYSGHMAKNVTSITTFKIVNITFVDTYPPVTTLTIGIPKFRSQPTHNWNVTTATTFTLSATDFFSSVSLITYRWDGAASWTTYSVPFTLGAAPAEGLHKLEFYAKDTIGNTETTHTVWVYLDKSTPAATLTIGAPKYRAGPTNFYNVTKATPFTITSSDQPGIDAMFYRIDVGTWKFYSGSFNLTGQSEGMHMIGYNARNNLGLNGSTWSESVILDDTGPATNYTLQGPNFRALPTDSWNITKQTKITLSSFDKPSGLNAVYYRIDSASYVTYSTPIDLSALSEGAHNFSAYAKDNVLNLGPTLKFNMWVDLTVPFTNISLGDPKYPASTTGIYNISPTTKITLNGTDDHSGVNKTTYKMDGGVETNYTAPFNISTFSTGIHSITFQSLDNVGNIEDWRSYDVYLDNVAPVTVITVGDPKYRVQTTDVWNVTGDTKFTLSSSDIGAGVKNIEYRTESGSFVTYVSPFSLSGLGQGEHTIWFKASDNVSNLESAKSMRVVVDKQGPLSNHTFDGATYRAKTTDNLNVTASTKLLLGASDAHSGVGSIWFRLELGTYAQYNGPIILGNYSEGMHVIDYYAKDALGNQGSTTTVRLVVVKKTPTIDVRFTPPVVGFMNKTYVGATAMINLSGASQVAVASIGYKIDAGSDQIFSAPVPLSTLAAGDHSVTAWCTDNLGLKSAQRTVNFTVDISSPATTLSYDLSPMGAIFDAPPTFTLTSSDTGSGVKAIYYKVDGAASYTTYTSPFKVEGYKDHTLKYYAADQLGNVEAAKTYTFGIIKESEPFLNVEPLPTLVNNPQLDVKGNGTLFNTVEIYLNDAYMDGQTLNELNFSFSVLLLEGDNTIQLKLIDSTLKVLVASPVYKVSLDTVAPSITNTTPAKDQGGVAINTRVMIKFSEELDQNVTVLKLTLGGTDIVGTLTYDKVQFRLIFKPTSYLEKETKYHVLVQVADKAGNPKSYEYDFTTSKETGPTDDDVVPLVDADGDGLDDDWEVLYFSDLSQTAQGDYDSDNFTNLEEYKASTDPTDPTDHPATHVTDDDTVDDDTGALGGATLAILLIVALVILIIIVIVIVLVMRRKKQAEEKPEEKHEKEEEEEPPVKITAKKPTKAHQVEAVDAEIVSDELFTQPAEGHGAKPTSKPSAAAKPVSAKRDVPEPKAVAAEPALKDEPPTPPGAPDSDLGSWELDGPGKPRSGTPGAPASDMDDIFPEDPYHTKLPGAGMTSTGRPMLALPPAQIFQAEFGDGPKLDELFVTTPDGILIKHFSYQNTTVVDEDILSSMLSVIQNFITDSFGKKGALKQLRLGEFNILITPGTTLNVVAISSEADLLPLEKPIEQMLKDLESQNEAVLKDWNGDPSGLAGIEDAVKKLVSGGYTAK